MSSMGVETVASQSQGAAGEPVQSDGVLKISVQKSTDSTVPFEIYSRTWNELVEWLRVPKHIYKSKEACPLLKLATFGDKRRDSNGSFRNDANVVEIFGVEGDYDDEKVSPAEALARLAKAGIRAVVYTSARHGVVAQSGNKGKPSGGGPRWRVLAPFSRPRDPAERSHFVDVLNGALGGVLNPESWNLSLTYYYGRVEGVPYECDAVEGMCIDDLDQFGFPSFEPIGKPNGAAGIRDAAKRDMPTLLTEAATPKWEPLGLSDRAKEFLSGEFLRQGDAVKGKRSDELAYTTRQLYQATCADGVLHDDVVLSILAGNDSAMRVALDHRQQKREKALRYLWDHHCLPGRKKVAAVLATADDINDYGSPLHSYYAYLPQHQYIDRATRQLFPAPSVDGNLRGVPTPDNVRPTVWLDKNRAAHQMTWDPNKPEVVEDQVVADGGWIESPGRRVFNMFRPALPIVGDPTQAGRWLDHLKRLFPEEWEHILKWLAHRVQRPGVKINHALVLGGKMGIGKDTLLEPVKEAVGRWNWTEITPQQMMGRFNGFVQSVVVRVNEARDLGDIDKFKFYDGSKQYIAAPPDVIRVDEKHRKEFPVINVAGIILTTNHKTAGLYLPADDRRHFVAWSPLSKEDFDEVYWNDLWGWLGEDGSGHVGAYLASIDLSDFDPKAPPPKTETFYAIVDAGQGSEDGDVDDILDDMSRPDAVTMDEVLQAQAFNPLGELTGGDTDLRGPKGSRKFLHVMERAGYSPVRNPDNTRGRWPVGEKRLQVFGRNDLALGKRLDACRQLLKRLAAVPR
jgi:hypothetical protein